MTQAHFLLSSPEFFGVEYVINPWMENHVHKIDHQLAKQQWQAFYDQLKQYATVSLLQPKPNMPDLVFTANGALIFNHKAILSHFRHPERRPEEPVFREWLLDHDYEIFEMPNDVYFEGAGDALFEAGNKRLWMGHGFRSLLTAKDYINKIINIEIVDLTLVNNRFYHLDTCFCPLVDGYLLYYPDAFSAESQQKIIKLVPEEKRIAVSKEDALRFACNAVEVPPTDSASNHGVIILNDASDELIKKLNEAGYLVIKTPMSEYLKSGGATKCLSLRI